MQAAGFIIGSSWKHILGLATVSMAGLFIFQALALGIVSLYLEEDLLSFAAIGESGIEMTAAQRRSWLFLGGMSSVGAFIVAPLLYMRFVEPAGTLRRLPLRIPRGMSWGICLLIMMAFIGGNAKVIEWNAGWQLPESFSRLETWMQEKEQLAQHLIAQFMHMPTLWDFFLTFFVIAVIAACGEELLFRGLLQTQLQRAFGNPHAGIWVAALLFSFFHLQFYGFVPRLLLGALFGYLYLFSGSLWSAVFAHFVNNSWVIVFLYFNSKGADAMDFNQDTVPAPLWVSGMAVVLVGILLYAFYRLEKEHKTKAYERVDRGIYDH